MAHIEQRNFCERVKKLFPDKFKGVDVLDIGSLDLNGNNRYLFEYFTYTGVDLGEGPNVDVVSLAHEFKPDKQYDVVISTECLEHDRYYKETIANAIQLLKRGGLLLFTCATTGRPEHGTKKWESWASPYSHVKFKNYYKNLTTEDIIPLIADHFSPWSTETAPLPADLYFYGIKR